MNKEDDVIEARGLLLTKCPLSKKKNSPVTGTPCRASALYTYARRPERGFGPRLVDRKRGRWRGRDVLGLVPLMGHPSIFIVIGFMMEPRARPRERRCKPPLNNFFFLLCSCLSREKGRTVINCCLQLLVACSAGLAARRFFTPRIAPSLPQPRNHVPHPFFFSPSLFFFFFFH